MTEKPGKPKRRSSQFTLRDLLLLAAVAGLATGWWVDRVELEQCRQQLKADQERAVRAERIAVELRAEAERERARAQRAVEETKAILERHGITLN